jgi:hypothetical protein
MDGGGLALDSQRNVFSVWRRQNQIFQALPGTAETKVAAGKDPAIAATERGVYVAWSGSAGLQARTPSGSRVTLDPKGAFVHLAALATSPRAGGAVLAAWESGGTIAIEILQ